MPLPEFVELYREMIRRVRSHGIRPILTNLPPLDSERFFNWWCGDLDKEAVMRWLGDVGNIYVWQERYSRAVERLAREKCAAGGCPWSLFGLQPPGADPLLPMVPTPTPLVRA